MRIRLCNLAIFILLVGSLSCMKKPNMDENATPATPQEVQKALSQSWGQADPLTMTPNDFVYHETEQRLEQQDPRLVLQEGITVSKKEESANEFDYTFLYQSAVISGNQSQQSTREDHRCVAKTQSGCSQPAIATVPGSVAQSDTAATAAVKTLSRMQAAAEVKPYSSDLQMTLGFERFVGLIYSCVKSDALDKYCKEELGADSCDIKCSNLVSTDEVQDAPPLMKAQPNCGDLPDCKLRLHRVSFDWSFVLKKGTSAQTQKINYTIALSPDLPFLSRVVEYCSRGLIDIPQTGNKVLVSICNRVKNYKHASP